MDAFTGTMFENQPKIYEKYKIFPTEEEWTKKSFILGTYELMPPPEELEKMLKKQME